jgi:hypothetical protein
MTYTFEEAWSDIQLRLTPGTVVKNWSPGKGYTGGRFKITGIDNSSVLIQSEHINQERHVSKEDFEHLFALWADYTRGIVGWSEFVKSSQNPSYIFSILHWREQDEHSPASTRPMLPAAAAPPPNMVSTMTTGGHDGYGKWIVTEATGGHAALSGPSVEIDYGVGPPARIDATVDDIAIEIESRVSKQVRGAVLDLICHPHPKKLLLLLPVHMNNPEVTAEQCRKILKRFCPDGSFRVLVLKGSGNDPQLAEDRAVVAGALTDLKSSSVASDNQRLSLKQAFQAMFAFLQQYYERGGNKDNLAAVLSDIQSIFEDGMPADPAAWKDWLDAVVRVLEKTPH